MYKHLDDVRAAGFAKICNAGLNTPFPLARIAAAMKASNDQKAIRLGEEKQRVGKFIGARPPQCFVDHGKLRGLSAMRCTTLSISMRKRGLDPAPQPRTSLARR
jgi:hypothetical protein